MARVVAAFVLLMATAFLTVDAAFPVPKNHPIIKTVTAENFRELVVEPTLPVVVEFMMPSCKHCKAFAPIYEEAAEALQGYAKFTVMDGSTEEGKGLAQMFGVQGFPAVLLFNPELLPVQGGQEGQYMKAPAAFEGARTLEAFTKWVLATMASHQIERLEDLQDTDDFLARYQMQDVPHVILFLSGDALTPPIYKAVTHEFRYGALFGVVNVSAAEGKDVAERYEVSNFPAVVTIASDGDVDRLEQKPDGEPVTLEKLTTFVNRVALMKEKRLQLQSFFMEDEINRRKKAQEEAKMNKALPPLVVSSEDEWKQHCLERKKGYCIVVFAEDPEAVDMTMLDEASKRIAKRTTHRTQIVILDGQANYDIAEYFEAVNGFPEIIYINPAKKGFHNHIGSMQPSSIITFFETKATVLRGKKYDLKKVPKFQVSTKPSEDEEISDE